VVTAGPLVVTEFVCTAAPFTVQTIISTPPEGSATSALTTVGAPHSIVLSVGQFTVGGEFELEETSLA